MYEEEIFLRNEMYEEWITMYEEENYHNELSTPKNKIKYEQQWLGIKIQWEMVRIWNDSTENATLLQLIYGCYQS